MCTDCVWSMSKTPSLILKIIRYKWVKRSHFKLFYFFISQLVSVKQPFSRDICKQWSLMTSAYHDVMVTTSKVSNVIGVKKVVPQ